MAIFKPGRLHRVLDKAGIAPGEPKFGLFIGGDGGTYRDEEIMSIATHRGKQSRGGGYAPATLEATVKGTPQISDISGQYVRASLTEPAALALATLVGTGQSLIMERCRGRIGAVNVEDNGNKKAMTTTFTAAAWLNMDKYFPAKTIPADGDTLYHVINNLIPDEQAFVKLNFHGTSDLVFGTQDPVTFAEGITKYAQDPGILLRDRRDGETDVMSIQFRKEWADTMMGLRVPLTRAQVLAPTEWSQPNEEIGVKVLFSAIVNAGAPFSKLVDTEPGDIRMKEQIEIDWSYIKTTVGGQLEREATAIVYERTPKQFRIPKVRVDILALIATGKSYHLAQVMNLLVLEAGDPVFLSADWPPMIQGVQYAEEITEKIDSNTWEIELSLLPYSSVTGYSPSPVVPGQVWDSMAGRWDTQTTRWDDH